MRKIRSFLSVLLTTAMLFSLTSCSRKLKEYDEETLTGILVNKLNIDEDDIYSVRNPEGQNDAPAGTVVTAVYNDARINVLFCDSADSAYDYFQREYDEFSDTFNQNGQFDGTLESECDKGNGYIIVNGEDIGSTLFGDRFATGSFHAGFYYTGSTIIVVLPEDFGNTDDVSTIISVLGYPDV